MTTKSAKQISTSSIFCSQLKKSIENLNEENSATNYVLSYTFLSLATETYLSGLFPYLLKWLSGKGRHTEIISTKKSARNTLSLNRIDLLESWYEQTAYQPLLRLDKKQWNKAQIPTFFEKIGSPILKSDSKQLYEDYYAPLYDIRNTVFHRNELITGNFGPDSFMDKYFDRKYLDSMILGSIIFIKKIEEKIQAFAKKVDFDSRPKKHVFAISSQKAFDNIYQSYQRAIPFLRDYPVKSVLIK
jgi:hypothetical protein